MTKSKIKEDGGFVTFDQIDAAFPFYMKGHFTPASLRRHRYYPGAFLPYYRGSKHHAPLYWRTSDLVAWLPRKFPQLPASAVEIFAANLREVALKEAPLTPTHASRAGRPPKWKKKRRKAGK